jgi:hypothetical protein
MARPEDNYVDVTQMCQANGKEWYEYVRTAGAIRFREALSAKPGIPRFGSGDDDDDGLVVTTRDEGGQRGHTFVDRRIALHCAAWIDPRFEVWVYGKIEELVTKGYTTLASGIARTNLTSEQTLMEVSQQGLFLIDQMRKHDIKFGELQGAINSGFGSVTQAIQESELAIIDRIEHPVARRPYNGKEPDALPYNEIRPTFVGMGTWYFPEFRVVPEHFYKGVYSTVNNELKFDVEAHKTAYLAQPRVLLGNPDHHEGNVSLVEVCERYGILRDVYRIAWNLTNGGTTSFPFQKKEPLDRSIYPITLEPRGPSCNTGKAVSAPLSVHPDRVTVWPGATPPVVVPPGLPVGVARRVCEPSVSQVV